MASVARVAENALNDIRFAIRQLRKSPGFAAAAIVTLALGMAASLAIFAFVDAVLIRPLPYKTPARLVGVFEKVEIFPQSNLSYLDYLDWKKLNTVFTSLAAYQGSGATMCTKDWWSPRTSRCRRPRGDSDCSARARRCTRLIDRW